MLTNYYERNYFLSVKIREKPYKGTMSDFQKYKLKRIEQNPEYWEGYQERFESFKVGVLLKQARKEAGFTQEEIARKLKTTKSVISRIENHSKDIRLSTLEKFAIALGKKIHIVLD